MEAKKSHSNNEKSWCAKRIKEKKLMDFIMRCEVMCYIPSTQCSIYPVFGFETRLIGLPQRNALFLPFDNFSWTSLKSKT